MISRCFISRRTLYRGSLYRAHKNYTTTHARKWPRCNITQKSQQICVQVERLLLCSVRCAYCCTRALYQFQWQSRNFLRILLWKAELRLSWTDTLLRMANRYPTTKFVTNLCAIRSARHTFGSLIISNCCHHKQRWIVLISYVSICLQL